MNLEKRIEQLERTVEAATAGECVHKIYLRVIESREQLERERAQDAAQPPPPPHVCRGRVRLVLVDDDGNPIDLEPKENTQ